MLQAIINKFLALDPMAGKHLSGLQNKTIAITCTDFLRQTWYFTFDNTTVLLISSLPENIDTHITSSLNGFVKFAVTQQQSDIQVTGDIFVAEQLQKLLLQLDIDWEEELSHFTGDVIASQIGAMFREFRQYQINSKDSLAEMISEYLQEESGILPTRYEINDFLQAVDDLRLMVDRLEAKVKIYASD